MKHEEQQRAALCRTILQTCRAELCEQLPYLDGAFQYLQWQLHSSPGIYVDGTAVHCSAREILSCYARAPAVLRRGYLHVLLHCLYLHPFSGNEGKWWELACDIAVEQLIERQGLERLRTDNPVRTKCLARLGAQSLSAEQLVPLLEEGFFDCSAEELRRAFAFDDPAPWRRSPGVRGQWEALLLSAAQNRSGGGKRGALSGAQEEAVQESTASGYDYRKFLRQFTFPREEVALDPESFDYILYQYGMEHCNAMPLIEPLEYREVRRLEELVIAIDTSHSCSRETVSRFLSETYRILSEQENFFRKMKVYFIQCDCLVQSVTLIQSREDWMSYAKSVTIHGRGGTDFTPVFACIEKLRARKELKHLRALLYFTDGDGAYPTQPPDYETAFVLLRGSGRRELVPGWARTLLI